MTDNPLIVKGATGTVLFDGTTVTIRRTGVLARLSAGSGEKVIPIASISALQFKLPGAMKGYIEFTVPGGNESRSRFGKQTTDAAKNENAVLFARSQREKFAHLRDVVQAAINERHQGNTTPAPPTADIPSQIKQLSELRDSGVITSEEFEGKKTELLGRL